MYILSNVKTTDPTHYADKIFYVYENWISISCPVVAVYFYLVFFLIIKLSGLCCNTVTMLISLFIIFCFIYLIFVGDEWMSKYQLKSIYLERGKRFMKGIITT